MSFYLMPVMLNRKRGYTFEAKAKA